MWRTHRPAGIHLSVEWICIEGEEEEEEERGETEAGPEPRSWLPSCLALTAPQQQPSSSLCWQRPGAVGWFQFMLCSCSLSGTHTHIHTYTTVQLKHTVSDLPHWHTTYLRWTRALCILCKSKLFSHDIHRAHTHAVTYHPPHTDLSKCVKVYKASWCLQWSLAELQTKQGCRNRLLLHRDPLWTLDTLSTCFITHSTLHIDKKKNNSWVKHIICKVKSLLRAATRAPTKSYEKQIVHILPAKPRHYFDYLTVEFGESFQITACFAKQQFYQCTIPKGNVSNHISTWQTTQVELKKLI